MEETQPERRRSPGQSGVQRGKRRSLEAAVREIGGKGPDGNSLQVRLRLEVESLRLPELGGLEGHDGGPRSHETEQPGARQEAALAGDRHASDDEGLGVFLVELEEDGIRDPPEIPSEAAKENQEGNARDQDVRAHGVPSERDETPDARHGREGRGLTATMSRMS